jgi:VWFA-related protein
MFAIRNPHRSALRRTLAPLLGLLALISAAPPVLAQQGEEAGTFFESVDVNVVNVEVFVTDRQGQTLTGLTQDDFELRVDGKPATITNFYAEVLGQPVRLETPTPPPPGTVPTPITLAQEDQKLHLIVFIDNSHISPTNRKRLFRALRDFLENNYSPDDAVTVVSYNRSVFVHSDFTSSREIIDRVLDDLSETAASTQVTAFERQRILAELFRRETGGSGRDPISFNYNRTALLQRIRAYAQQEFQLGLESIQALTRFMQSLGGVQGRKALLHVSDGIPTKPGEDIYFAWLERFATDPNNPTFVQDLTSYPREVGDYDLLPHFRQLGRNANANGVTLYALDGESDHGSRVRSAANEGFVSSEVMSLADNNYREPLELTTQITGGRRIQASSRLEEEMAQLATDFNTYYSLGFQVESSEKDKTRQIEVKVNRKGLRVRHRDSYDPKNRDERTGQATLAALLYNAVANPLGVQIEAGPTEKRQDGNSVLPLHLAIPVKNLVLLPEEAGHTLRLSLFVSVKDKAGEARPVQKVPFHLTIPSEVLQDALKNSARYTLPVILRPGDQQVALGIRDDIALQESTVRVEVYATSPRTSGP